MRTKNQETLDRILKFVNKYYQEHHSSPTINDVAEGVGVARSTTHRYLQELSDRNLIDYSRGILSAPQSAKMKTAYVSAPLVGSIRCGNPEDEEESIEEYVSLPVSMFGKGDFYILRAKGDSMVDAGIDEDDLLVIERNCPALEGDIVVALDEDNQNTLKRYRGFDEDEKCFVLEYENEARYPVHSSWDDTLLDRHTTESDFQAQTTVLHVPSKHDRKKPCFSFCFCLRKHRGCRFSA